MSRPRPAHAQPWPPAWRPRPHPRPRPRPAAPAPPPPFHLDRSRRSRRRSGAWTPTEPTAWTFTSSKPSSRREARASGRATLRRPRVHASHTAHVRWLRPHLLHCRLQRLAPPSRPPRHPSPHAPLHPPARTPRPRAGKIKKAPPPGMKPGGAPSGVYGPKRGGSRRKLTESESAPELGGMGAPSVRLAHRSTPPQRTPRPPPPRARVAAQLPLGAPRRPSPCPASVFSSPQSPVSLSSLARRATSQPPAVHDAASHAPPPPPPALLRSPPPPRQTRPRTAAMKAGAKRAERIPWRKECPKAGSLPRLPALGPRSGTADGLSSAASRDSAELSPASRPQSRPRTKLAQRCAARLQPPPVSLRPSLRGFKNPLGGF